MGSTCALSVMNTLSALLTPVIATIVAYIAWQQMRIAGTKLDADLYDRRYAIFEAAQQLLADVFKSGDASNDALRAFTIGTSHARFLFDEDLVNYLDTLYGRAARLHGNRAGSQSAPGAQADSAALKAADSEFQALKAEQENLVDKFLPYLQRDRRVRARTISKAVTWRAASLRSRAA